MKHLPMPAELMVGGVILVDKPYNWTSFDAVNSIKRIMYAKIGHCGTLDPLATGLLICCTGKFTKKISEYQKLPKEYTGIVRLGAVTASYDRETKPEDIKPTEHVTPEMIAEAVAKLTGEIMQVPPIHSAIKKDGERAYDLARAGKEIVLQPRPVTIHEFEITRIEMPEVHFRIACSTGTYIRSIANDLGALLGCGGYLQELRRTRIGDFSVEDAIPPEQWKQYWYPDGVLPPKPKKQRQPKPKPRPKAE
jgi:tRNA pseudouridine55 synthase